MALLKVAAMVVASAAAMVDEKVDEKGPLLGNKWVALMEQGLDSCMVALMVVSTVALMVAIMSAWKDLKWDLYSVDQKENK